MDAQGGFFCYKMPPDVNMSMRFVLRRSYLKNGVCSAFINMVRREFLKKNTEKPVSA
jgi:hypothetical protein